MTTISLKLPPHDLERLKAMARERRTSKSALVRQAIKNLVKDGQPAVQESLLDRMEDMVGIVDGPEDLSTNPKHLMEALRDNHSRRRADRGHPQQE